MKSSAVLKENDIWVLAVPPLLAPKFADLFSKEEFCRDRATD
jgi:hypothetical protein